MAMHCKCDVTGGRSISCCLRCGAVCRYLLDSGLEEVGDWQVCLKIMYANWDTTHYQGEITINYV
jgi:hypothetical protein